MAIIEVAKPVDSDPSEGESLLLKFTNGDLAALKTVLEDWNFRNYEALLKFALAAMVQSGTPKIKIEDANGKDVTLQPAGNLLREVEAPAAEANGDGN